MPNPNPNRSGLKNFKKGQSGNPGGKTKETVSIERSNAEKALKLRAMGLDALLNSLDGADDGKALEALLSPYALKMLKDAEDRGLGAPVQAVISPDGSAKFPDIIQLVTPNNDNSTD